MFSVDIQGASYSTKKSIPKDNKGMHAELGFIAMKLFPKMCQLILQSIIPAKNLYRSFQTKSELKIILVDDETSIIESMQTDEYKNFTVQLCYKILRHEQWLDPPSQNWGQMPTHTDSKISDDIERIRLTSNRIVTMETTTLDKAVYLNFIEDIKQIAKRVEMYLKKPQMFCRQIQLMEPMDPQTVETTLTEIRRLSVIEDDPYPSNPIQQGRTRYARLGLVVVDTFPKMVREITRHNISADVLSRHISKQSRTNPSLLNKITHEERVRLNTLSSNTYDNIDFITIYKLLRSFSLVDQPSQGWGKQPTNADVKISDDIERLRIMRNKIVHRIKADIDILEMNYHFATLVTVTQRIDVYLNKPVNQGFTKEVQDFQTFCMDFEMEQKYFQALKDIEDIKEKFAVKQAHFHYGKTFTNFIKEVKATAQKTERRGISIVLEDVDDSDKRKILNELNVEINSGLVNIEFKQAVSGSLVLCVNIINNDVWKTEQNLGDELYSFLYKTLELVELESCLQTDLNVVLVKDEDDDFEVEITFEDEAWDDPMDKPTSVKPSELTLDLDVKKEFFSTDDNMQLEIGRLVDNIMRTNGNSNHVPVNARLEPGNYGNVDLNENTRYGFQESVISEEGENIIDLHGEEKERMCKIIVIGDPVTGKTCFVKRYVHQTYFPHYRASIGVDFALKNEKWNFNTNIKLQLWDIAGQERFGSMTRVYYKDTDGCLILFDVTKDQSLEGAAKWKKDLDSKVTLPDGSPVPCILLANKCDLTKTDIVKDASHMDQLCKEKGFVGWFETSAKENINVNESTRFLISKMVQNAEWKNGKSLS